MPRKKKDKFSRDRRYIASDDDYMEFLKQDLKHSRLRITIKSLKELIEAGKRYQTVNYKRLRLHVMLAMAEKKLELLTTTNMSIEGIERQVRSCTRVRPVYFLPGLGELIIKHPADMKRHTPIIFVRQGELRAVYSTILSDLKRWQRIDHDQFEYIDPDELAKQSALREVDAQKKPLTTMRRYKLAFRKKIDIHPTLNPVIGAHARALITAAAVEHRKILRDRLKTTRSPQNELLITSHVMLTEHGPLELRLASLVKKVTWKSSRTAQLYLDIIPALESDHDDILQALDDLNKRWDQPEPAKDVA